MWYKEWLTVRFKFGFWLALYIFAAIIVVFFGSSYRIGGNWRDPAWVAESIAHYPRIYTFPYPQPLFLDWLDKAYPITVGLALFGGMDIISGEISQNTLSFLLVRPLSRTALYTSKLLINIGALGVAFISVSLLMLLVDRTTVHPIKIVDGLALTLLVWLLGVATICLGGLISIFTRNVIQTLALTIIAVIVPVSSVSIIGWQWIYYLSNTISIQSQVLVAFTVISILAAIFYRLGLLCFRHRQF